jgi:hypothetical protein
MKKKGFTTEQIIGKQRKAEVLLGQGSTVGGVSCKLGIMEQTYYFPAILFFHHPISE